MSDWNPIDTPNFSRKEMQCKCGNCGKSCSMQSEFMDKLQRMSYICGFALIVNSGFRCRLHPVEINKALPGAHVQGRAADLKPFNSHQRFMILKSAFEVGMVGVALENNFIHVDDGHEHASRPSSWVY